MPPTPDEDGANAADSERYANYLLGSFIDDRHFGFNEVQTYIWDNWGQHAWLVGREGSFFIIKFSSMEYLLAILHNGPYSVEGGLFVVRQWEPGLVLSNLRITQILVWVRLSGIPIEYINQVTGRKLASLIGEVQEVHAGSLDPYAVIPKRIRASVWVNPANPLQSGFYLRLLSGFYVWVPCSYERLHNFCRRCGRIGHLMTRCPIQDDAALEAYIDEYFQRFTRERGLEMVCDRTHELYPSTIRAHRHKPAIRTTHLPPSYFEQNMHHFLPSNAARFSDGFRVAAIPHDSDVISTSQLTPVPASSASSEVEGDAELL